MAYSECNWQYIKVAIASDGVATLTLARADIGNAFDEQMISELTQACTKLSQDAAVKIIVLRAEGKHFCTGADLNWMRKASNYTLEENQADALRLSAMLAALAEMQKPTIAVINGACYGGGVGLAAAVDLVVAENNVRFCLSEVKLGLIPAVISPYLINAMGARQAKRVMLTAESINSSFALALGLVHEIGSDADACDAIVAGWVKSLLANSQEALQAVKDLVKHVAGRSLDQELKTDLASRIAAMRISPEAQSRMRAFLEKK